MVFQDPILAGATLVRDGIQSENYVAGQKGWRISRDGAAEFLSGLYRGSLDLGGGQQTDPKIHLGSDIPAELVSFYANSNPVRACILFYSGQGATPANRQYVYIALTTGPAVANLAIGYWDTATVREHFVVDGSFGGLMLGSADPAAEIRTRKPITLVNEPWKPLTLAAPFTVRGGGYRPPSFRLVASPPNSLQIDGQFNFGGAGNGALLAVLPVGYRPKTYTTQFPVNGPMVAGGQIPIAELDISGNLRLYSITAGTTSGAVMGVAPLD